MTRKERVIAALTHRETGIIPYYADFTAQSHRKLAAYLDDPDFESKLGTYLYYPQYNGWPTERPDKPEHFVDIFGVEWNRSGADKDIGVIDHPVIPDIANHNYIFPEPDEARIRSDMERMLAGAGDRFTMGTIGFSVFERAWSLLSMEETFIAMLTEPLALHALLDSICEHNLKTMDIMLDYPVDGFYFGDDWGQQRGLMMGAENWRKFIKPVVKKLYARAKRDGKFVLQHSCGDIQEIFPDLIEIGLDCYQTFQPEIYEIESVKRQFGGDLSFWGGISTQQLLPYADERTIRRETRRIMAVMGKGGGYIAAPTHTIPGDVPPENIMAMMSVFQDQQR